MHDSRDRSNVIFERWFVTVSQLFLPGTVRRERMQVVSRDSKGTLKPVTSRASIPGFSPSRPYRVSGEHNVSWRSYRSGVKHEEGCRMYEECIGVASGISAVDRDSQPVFRERKAPASDSVETVLSRRKIGGRGDTDSTRATACFSSCPPSSFLARKRNSRATTTQPTRLRIIRGTQEAKRADRLRTRARAGRPCVGLTDF